jgi:hypothetical protein
MNYEQMSDFEINKAVGKLVGLRVGNISNKEDCFVGHTTPLVIQGATCGCVTNWFNPCNNPSDAWPIILDNSISVINISGTTQWFAANGVSFENICLRADGGDDGICCMDSKLESYSTNPLRAAMIVFLMISNSSEQ